MNCGTRNLAAIFSAHGHAHLGSKSFDGQRQEYGALKAFLLGFCTSSWLHFTSIHTYKFNMALASAPSTPERRFQEPLVRRSFTAPINSANQNLPSFGSDEQKAETLFAHGTVKVVQFSNSGKLARRHSSVSDGKSELHEAAVGTLPWASLTERTIAAGE